MKEISSGAEAKIYLSENKIIKKRISKDYRLKEIDDYIRGFRTRREAKILQKLPSEVCHPTLLKCDEKETIEMSYIDGKKVRDILDKNIQLCEDIGKKTALMHNSGIIHGDLTTSNMILYGGKIYFIDFGLSFFSDKVEDKAVDIHLFKQALESKHYKVYDKAFAIFIKGYKKEAKNYLEIKKRFDLVELRGRNKAKF